MLVSGGRDDGPGGSLSRCQVADRQGHFPAVIASGGNPFAQSCDRLVGAITALLQAGAAAGAIRPDIEPADVLASLSGVSLAAGEPAQRDQARRLLNLLMDVLRYRAAAAH